MVRKIAIIAVLLFCSAAFAEEGATDAEIMEYLMNSTLYIDNFEGARWDFQHARDLCGANSNRFARILGELAHTNDAKIAECMISLLVQYGTSAQLPFLYSQATNVEYGADAVRSILRIEGITSNSVALVDSYLSMTNMTNRNRYYVCSDFIGKAFSSSVSAAMQLSSEQVYLRFMAESNIYHDWLDSELRTRDSSYAQSKRRLDVLRSVCDRTNDPADLNFVTNAINELVAYPEADLPD